MLDGCLCFFPGKWLQLNSVLFQFWRLLLIPPIYRTHTSEELKTFTEINQAWQHPVKYAGARSYFLHFRGRNWIGRAFFFSPCHKDRTSSPPHFWCSAKWSRCFVCFVLFCFILYSPACYASIFQTHTGTRCDVKSWCANRSSFHKSPHKCYHRFPLVGDQ